MTERTRGSGPLPWGRVFDPEANVRALGEVQERGLRAASDLVDRLVAAVDGRRTATAAPGPVPADDGEERTASPTDALVQVWTDLLHRGIDAFTQLAQPREPDGSVTVDLAGARPPAALALVIAAGARCAAEVWLHNPGPEPLGTVRPEVGELRAVDGTVLPAGSVRFEPTAVEVGAASSTAVTVEVAVDAGTVSGCFRGIVQVAGAPDVWLPIEVAVR